MAYSYILSFAFCTGLLLHTPSNGFIDEELTRTVGRAAIAVIAAYTVAHNLNAWFGPKPSVPEIATEDKEVRECIKATLAQNMPIAPEIITFLNNKNLALTLDVYNSQLRINEQTHNVSTTAQEVFNKAKNQALNLLNTKPKSYS